MNIVYGIANLANYIVGAGILGLPFVFSKTGWAVGCFLILLAAFATSLSFDFLLQASTASRCVGVTVSSQCCPAILMLVS
jgi:amino acid permease